MFSVHNTTWNFNKNMRNKIFLGAFLAVYLSRIPIVSYAQGKGFGVEVRSVSPKMQDALPGRILSISYLVTNNTDSEEEFIENLQLPTGWQAIVPMSSFILQAGDTTTRIIVFQVPLNAQVGRYEIAYKVQSQRDYAIQDTDTVTVVVLPLVKISLLMEEKPESVIAGEVYKIKLRLVNQSNVRLKVKLEVASEENYPAKIEPQEVMIEALRNMPVIVTVQTYKKESKPRTQYVRVNAEALEARNGETKASLTVGVEIIPRISVELDIYHRLPAKVTLRLNGKDDNNGVQLEFQGSGSLDEEGKKTIDFLFRGPDTQSKGIFGLRDEFRLSYFTPKMSVRLGDQNYGLSRLTSYYHYGRGAGMDFFTTKFPTSFGAYYLNERWGLPDKNELGMYIAYKINEKVSARLNFLHRNQDAYNSSSAITDTIWSIESQIKPNGNMNIENGICQL